MDHPALDSSTGLRPDHDQGPALIKIIWILLGISTLFCAARIYVKIKIFRKIFWDDVFVILALVMGMMHGVCITLSQRTGLGKHMLRILAESPEHLSHTVRVGFYSFVWAFLSPMAGRLSFCFFLLWVTGENPRVKRWPIYIFMVLQVVINVVSVVLMYSQCGTHLDVLWTLSRISEVTELCLDPRIQTWWGYVAGSLNSLTDLFLTVFPAVVISFSKLTLRSRIGLMALLCLSALAMVAAIKRTIESRVLSELSDYTYELIPFIIWASVELNVVIIASTIPILRPLFKRNGLSSVLRRTVVETSDLERAPSVSIYEKGRMTSHTTSHLSSRSSEEKMIPPRPQQFVITRTVEMSVSHTPRERNLVHAALIGLPAN